MLYDTDVAYEVIMITLGFMNHKSHYYNAYNGKEHLSWKGLVQQCWQGASPALQNLW